MAKKKVTFIATKYKNKKTNVNFYTKKGEKISFDSVKKAPVKQRVEFYMKP